MIGLAATFAAVSLLARAEEQRRQVRLEGLADTAASAIESRMLAQLTILRGAAGLFNASDDVTPADFRAYVARIRLQRFYPGVLGIGYAGYAPDRSGLRRLVESAERRVAPDIRTWPSGERTDYSAILYLEPLNRRNRQALGYDMLSEPTRREAMEAARRTGLAAATGRVRLVQEIDPVKQPGFLIYMPLYRGQRAGILDKPSQADFYGWVYSPLRAHDLFDAIFAGRDLDRVNVEVFDEAIDEGRLLYRRGRVVASGPALVRTLDVGGREWLVRVTPSPKFADDSVILPAPLAGVAGVLMSLLVAALVFQQARAAARTREEVARRTAELRSTNERLVAEAVARAEAEDKVRQMQKLEAIGQLTGGIAHDFNNMLSIIVGNLDIAERRLDDRDRLRRAIDNARTGADKAAELTRRLLAFSRQQPLSPKVIDPNKLVAGMSELLRRALGEAIRLETVLAGGLWRVCADAGQLENAILNLAVNAHDAMPEGGALTIETANCHLDEAYARRHDVSPGQYVMISVSDTGHGMSKAVAEKALEPFFTTKDVGRGTGLGLSQVAGYVKQSDGHLKLYSEVGEGTTVKIYLPRHHGLDEETATPAEETASPRSKDGETLLVVEDEEQVRAATVETLRDLGYTVIEAANGTEALDRLDRGAHVDLLFTDIVMPGLNGRQLADKAREQRRGLKVLFTTGYARNAIVHHGRLEDGLAVLQKPFTAWQLAKRVRDELDR